MTNSNNKPTAKPIYRKQLPGGISSAVFENSRDGRVYRSVNLQRSYYRDGKWNRLSLYLDHEHIPFMIEVLEATWKFLNDYPISGVSNESESDSATDNTIEPVDGASAEIAA
jgi:hypothetical protein